MKAQGKIKEKPFLVFARVKVETAAASARRDSSRTLESLFRLPLRATVPLVPSQSRSSLSPSRASLLVATLSLHRASLAPKRFPLAPSVSLRLTLARRLTTSRSHPLSFLLFLRQHAALAQLPVVTSNALHAPGKSAVDI